MARGRRIDEELVACQGRRRQTKAGGREDSTRVTSTRATKDRARYAEDVIERRHPSLHDSHGFCWYGRGQSPKCQLRMGPTLHGTSSPSPTTAANSAAAAVTSLAGSNFARAGTEERFSSPAIWGTAASCAYDCSINAYRDSELSNTRSWLSAELSNVTSISSTPTCSSTERNCQAASSVSFT
jgi:hypothetical protein